MNFQQSDVFPGPAFSSGYDHTHPNLILIKNDKNVIASMFYKVNDEPDILLYSHGNGTDIGHLDKFLSKFSYSIGMNIISYDYPGYGLSTICSKSNIVSVSDTEEQCYKTINTVFNYLLNLGSKCSDIILYGTSIGTGPTVDLAMRTNGLKGVILQTPFTKISVTDDSGSLICTIFENYKKIHLIDSMVSILHGTLDEVVPYSHGVMLSNILDMNCSRNHRFITIDDASHNNIELDHYDSIVSVCNYHQDTVES